MKHGRASMEAKLDCWWQQEEGRQAHSAVHTCLSLVVIYSPDADLFQVAVAQELPYVQDLRAGIRMLAQAVS